MEAYERYYRRAYNAINRLIEVYKDGYKKDNTLKFIKDLFNKLNYNPKAMQQEFNNIMFTISIALLGLNKEAIENSGKIVEYRNDNIFEIDKSKLTNEHKLRLKEFNDSKVISTDFDNWLSIKINPNTDRENIDYLRRVRNSLLHSNFYLDEDMPYITFAKLKTKSYYEAELFGIPFQTFIFQYFGNIDSLGLSEASYIFNVPKKQITDHVSFIQYLLSITINKITYKNLRTVGIESPEFLLKSSSDNESNINIEKFVNKLKDINSVDDIKWETLNVSTDNITHLMLYIDKLYGKEFYNLDVSVQNGIITTYLKYQLDPKTELSNWMCHFWYLYTSINNPNFTMDFFDGDSFGTDSCYPSLMVLKSYLLMYRLQNNNFDEVDYSKIDFNKNDKDIFLHSENKDGSLVTDDYFEISFEKEKCKDILTDENQIWNKVICEVVRNSLAHGNVRTYLSTITIEPMIELKDIDPKKGTTRAIVFTLSKYERFLNSEAFLPSNCYRKEDAKVLIKNK